MLVCIETPKCMLLNTHSLQQLGIVSVQLQNLHNLCYGNSTVFVPDKDALMDSHNKGHDFVRGNTCARSTSRCGHVQNSTIAMIDKHTTDHRRLPNGHNRAAVAASKG